MYADEKQKELDFSRTLMILLKANTTDERNVLLETNNTNLHNSTCWLQFKMSTVRCIYK